MPSPTKLPRLEKLGIAPAGEPPGIPVVSSHPDPYMHCPAGNNLAQTSCNPVARHPYQNLDEEGVLQRNQKDLLVLFSCGLTSVKGKAGQREASTLARWPERISQCTGPLPPVPTGDLPQRSGGARNRHYRGEDEETPAKALVGSYHSSVVEPGQQLVFGFQSTV